MASLSRSTLNSNADTNIEDNTSGNILPADIRGHVKDLADSSLNPNDDLAAQAEAEAGTNNTKFMTPLRTAEAIAALAGGGGPISAWIEFDGTGTPSISDDLNIASITDNGTGNYTLNFDTALANANYAVLGSSYGSATYGVVVQYGGASYTKTTAAVQVVVNQVVNGNAFDSPNISVAILGGQ